MTPNSFPKSLLDLRKAEPSTDPLNLSLGPGLYSIFIVKLTLILSFVQLV